VYHWRDVRKMKLAREALEGPAGALQEEKH